MQFWQDWNREYEIHIFLGSLLVLFPLEWDNDCVDLVLSFVVSSEIMACDFPAAIVKQKHEED